jgi:hypothetical protein
LGNHWLATFQLQFNPSISCSFAALLFSSKPNSDRAARVRLKKMVEEGLIAEIATHVILK